MISDYQRFIHTSRYARWDDELQRRETWEETVTRLVNYYEYHLKEYVGYTLKQDDKNLLYKSIVSMSVMPSMRAMMTAGAALERNNIAGYNCSYVAVDSPRAFDDVLYILMHGTGVGFSVERNSIEQLPKVAEEFQNTDTTVIVRDSKEGWHSAYKELINLLYAGQIPKWDMGNIRPAGSKLKTFGGRASGPEPLEDLFNFTVNKFKSSAGRKLNSLECHDIVCKIAEVVVVGGVRRSALLSLSNLTDARMRSAKGGNWYDFEPQRALSNNSVCYTEKPDVGIFMREWLSLYESKSGERGIFNRVAAQKQADKYGRRDSNYDFGTNPCSEIILRSKQFCNLTEVVVRKEDDKQSLINKVKVATILGTIQSTFTNIKNISKIWTNNTEEERLLGVSLTGIMDNELTCGLHSKSRLESLLNDLRVCAVQTNKVWSGNFGINTSTAITCVKPSGTVSQLVDSASGIHTRHSPYYIRTVRADKKDPLTQFLVEQKVPHEDCVMQPKDIIVFSFPIKSPEGAVTRNDLTATQHLDLWRVYQSSWCEHKPSITISVKEAEWMQVGSYVWDNFDEMCGVSFLPFTDHVYRQAPYQDLEQSEYDTAMAKMPESIDWSKLSEFESEDRTTSSQEFACTAEACEIVDIGDTTGA